jgi:hypothetical protein
MGRVTAARAGQAAPPSRPSPSHPRAPAAGALPARPAHSARRRVAGPSTPPARLPIPLGGRPSRPIQKRANSKPRVFESMRIRNRADSKVREFKVARGFETARIRNGADSKTRGFEARGRPAPSARSPANPQRCPPVHSLSPYSPPLPPQPPFPPPLARAGLWARTASYSASETSCGAGRGEAPSGRRGGGRAARAAGALRRRRTGPGRARAGGADALEAADGERGAALPMRNGKTKREPAGRPPE